MALKYSDWLFFLLGFIVMFVSMMPQANAEHFVTVDEYFCIDVDTDSISRHNGLVTFIGCNTGGDPPSVYCVDKFQAQVNCDTQQIRSHQDWDANTQAWRQSTGEHSEWSAPVTTDSHDKSYIDFVCRN